jgi:hypothetical protein
MASIDAAVRQVKDDVTQWLTATLVAQACAAADYRWRTRVLTPWVTVHLFVLQVLWGNVACRRVRHLSKLTFTGAAYCAARMRLPVDVFSSIAASRTHEARRQTRDFGRWKGHRVFHADGSGLSMPDEEALQQAFGQPVGQKSGCGFPVMAVLWLFDAGTGLLADFVTDKCCTHDMKHAAKLHAAMDHGDVMVADCAFASFAHLALLLQDKLHGVFRVHQRQIVDFTPGRKHRRQRPKSKRKGAPTSRWIRKLGEHDQLVAYVKPDQRPAWISEQDYDQLPDEIVVRELRYRIERPGFRTQQVTLVTTLLDRRKYPMHDLAELYRARWAVETNLKHLKQTMHMDVLRSKTVEGVRKELWVYLIVYNQVRLLMCDAAERQGVVPDRISFIDALDALRHHGWRAAQAVTLVVDPHRHNRDARHEPRVIKRRKDRYTYMTKPREVLREALGITKVAA